MVFFCLFVFFFLTFIYFERESERERERERDGALGGGAREKGREKIPNRFHAVSTVGLNPTNGEIMP